MFTTKHYSDRKIKRSITDKMVELALDYGSNISGSRMILSKKEAAILLKEAESLRDFEKMNTLRRIINKKGLVVVCDHSKLITTY